MTGPTRFARFDQFEVLLKGRVALVYIDRPAKLNAMTDQFWPQLRDLLDEICEVDTVRAIVITGRGEKAFSAGGDIEGFGDLTTVSARRAYMTGCMATFAAIERCRLPVVAAINGIAFGGGCELALACDIVLAGESATFAMPEARVGLVPGFGIQRAPSVIGKHWTKYLVLAGEQIDAQTAQRIGLVQRVLPDDGLVDAAVQLGERISGLAPLAVEVGKQIVNQDLNPNLTSDSVTAVSLLYSTDDVAEGIRAFVERREPRFEGQ